MSFFQKFLTLSLLLLYGAFAASPAFASGTCLTITQNLYVGLTDKTSKGQVSQLQAFFDIHPRGYFGAITKAAVQSWQASHSIATQGVLGYGVVGPKTRAALACAGTQIIVPVINSDPIPTPVTSTQTQISTTAATVATTSPFVANIPSLFGSSTLPIPAVGNNGVSQAIKNQLIGVILSEQKIYASSDVSEVRTFLINSTADEPTLSASYKTMTDDQVSQFFPLMHQIATSIPSEAVLRAPTTGWQVDETKATIQVGGITVTLKKINGAWY